MKSTPSWAPYQGYLTKKPKSLTKRHRREYPERDLVHLPLMKMVRKHPILGIHSKLFFHVENERKTVTYAQGAMRKAMGVKPGISDLLLLYPSRGYHGCCIELKAPTKKLTEAQDDFLQQAAEAGYITAYFDDPQKAYRFLIWYLCEEEGVV